MTNKVERRKATAAYKAITTDYEAWRDHEKDNAVYNRRMNVIEVMAAKVKTESGLTIADEINLVQCIAVSELSDKMTDFYAVSTSCLMNPRCRERAKNPELICFYCYATGNAVRFSGLMQCIETNYRILNTHLLSETALATLAIPTKNGAARIEAHGDVASVICARNYIRIIKTHPWIHFGVWTKNLDLWLEAFRLEGKPENMTFIVSSCIVNKVYKVPESAKQYVNKVFTVYSKEYAEQNKITINCGTYEGTHPVNARCNACMRCYSKTDSTYYINEILK